MTAPFFSIVITTKNEELNIDNCLQSIFSQTYNKSNYEIIVVDNFSDDKTIEICKKYPSVAIFTMGPERNVQRNYGLLEKARGEYLIWIDADMILHPSILDITYQYIINDNKPVAYYYPEVILGNSIFSCIRRFERQFYNGTVIDGSRVIKRSAFIKVGGFSRDWLHGPDDWDLDMHLKLIGNIVLISEFYENSEFSSYIKDKFNLNISMYPVSIYHNESELGIINHLKKKLHYSTDCYKYIDKWGSDNPMIIKQFGFKYRFVTIFFENNKWKKLIKNPFLYLGFLITKSLTALIFIYVKYEKHSNNRY